MNEQRIAQYVQLIQELLACPNGQELVLTEAEVSEILANNSELVDEGLVLTMTDFASQLDNENAANFLMQMASGLAEYLGMSESNNVETLQANLQKGNKDYFQFLMKLLQLVSDSDGNPHKVYPFLLQNLDKLDSQLKEVLKQWANQMFTAPETDAQEKYYIAVDIFTLGNLMQQFPLGKKPENMEISIECFQTALTVYTPDAFPQYWAMTQNNLATAYSDRIKGSKADNLELAINCYLSALTVLTPNTFPQEWAATQNNLGEAYRNRIEGAASDNLEQTIECYQAALTVYTRDALPQNWATTQNNLGIAYTYRIEGSKANNLELAIKCFQDALTVFTRDALPQNWATTQNNLGIAYTYCIKESKADNLELAIKCYQDALTVRTHYACPQEWAQTQNNLAIAYSNRIKGSASDNLEQAIKCFQAALTVFTRDAFPQEWAQTQNNLGEAYRNRIKGSASDNLEQAIKCFQDSLTVFTRDAFPQYWAQTQNNLGLAYRDHIKGSASDNLEQAIKCFQDSLIVFTRDAFPQNWATTQNNLATAYSDRIKGSASDNLEQAIKCFQDALTVFTRDAFPQDWAQTQNNLGEAYRNRIKGSASDNLERSIECSLVALAVRTRDAFPQDYANTCFNLGLAYKDQQKWKSAHDNFADAIDTIEYLRSEIKLQDTEAKQKQAEDSNKLYRSMIEVCLELKQYSKAIEYAERSKTRNLVELITVRDLYSKGEIPVEVENRLREIRQQIDEEARALAVANEKDYTKINQLRAEYNDIFPYKPLNFDKIKELTDKKTVIVEWYILDDRFCAFILTKQEPQIQHLPFPEVDLDQLIDWANKYLEEYQDYRNEKSFKWKENLASELEKLGQILHIDEIVKNIPKECAKLVLIPHRYLHLFPLHALPVTGKKGQKEENQNDQKTGKTNYLIDLFPEGLSYAPSCQLLHGVRQKSKPQINKFFAIQNPSQAGDQLYYTDIEVDKIRQLFSQDETIVLKEKEATKTACQNALNSPQDITHFSCHGYFNLEEPLKSALMLAGSELKPAPTEDNPDRYLKASDNSSAIDLEKCLTLVDIFQLNLTNCSLVTLSACETGLIDPTNSSDEYIGMPSAFLFAGSSALVQSLWSVDEFSTSFLLIKFYENLIEHKLPMVLALNQAQIWLRNVSKNDFIKWVKGLGLPQEQSEEIETKVKYDDDQPFAGPQYWAGFCFSGKTSPLGD